jgi:CSLREA domain-containing protein
VEPAHPITPRTSSHARRRAAACISAVLVLAVKLALSAIPAAAAPGSYVVNTTQDANDPVLRNNCLVGVGTCTLRAALAMADSDGIASTIDFAIPGTGPHTIAITSTLDDMTEGNTTVNGYSQPGASENTLDEGSNAVIRVEIRGPGMVGGGVRGLVLTSSNNTIRGLAIYNMWQTIHVGSDDASGNVIAGNFIGTDAAATFGASVRNNGTFGIVIRSASDNNTVGGPNPEDRNVISGLAGRGVLIGVPSSELSTGTDFNVVQNNIVGLTPNGLTNRPNFGHGIDLNNGVSNNKVIDNVVSGNAAEGIEVSHGQSTRDNEVVSNRIGTDLAGTAGPSYARNGSNGIQVEDGADRTVVRDNVVGNSGGHGMQIGSLTHSATSTRIEDNRIGVSLNGTPIPNASAGIRLGPGEGSSNQAASVATVIGVGNVIAHNEVGIRVEGSLSVRNRITDNSIFENSGLGIDLAPISQVNQNDPGDGDSGPNTLLNWPVLSDATSTSVSGTACAGCRVEVFLADRQATLDASLQTSYGEGEALVATATADGSGNFTAALPSSAAGRIITATATDGSGNTSEFGRNLAVPGTK